MPQFPSECQLLRPILHFLFADHRWPLLIYRFYFGHPEKLVALSSLPQIVILEYASPWKLPVTLVQTSALVQQKTRLFCFESDQNDCLQVL